MKTAKPFEVSYFPGCSMKTSAKENNESLKEFFKKINITLEELPDWSCCGSSSAHCVDSELAHDLATRNLSIAPPDKPLLVSCPSCTLRLKQAHLHTLNDQALQDRFLEKWGKPFNPDLKIIHYFELLKDIDFHKLSKEITKPLTGLKFVPYYGCMLARPPEMRHAENYHGLLESILSSLGATPLDWGSGSRCCGTFLSVAKPDAITPIVNEIIQNGIDTGADCLITACSMCQLNLEIRCNLKHQIPTLHFSEVLSLAMGTNKYKRWFPRHLVDPTPLLTRLGLIE
jgi:heterodisulfide reductase subunit B